MFKKTTKKAAAAIMALALAISAIPSLGGIEAQAATETKVMEAEVSFMEMPQTGDQSSVYFSWISSCDDITFGKTYSLNMDIYVPEALMKTATLWISPQAILGRGNSLETVAGYLIPSNTYAYNIYSDAVTKVGDFYQVHVEAMLDRCWLDTPEDIDFPEGQGMIVASVYIPVAGADYTGSIYFDNVSIVVDGQAVTNETYEDGNVIVGCSYTINDDRTERTPEVVSFTGKALTVSKTSLSVKKGKTATIKAATMPSAKVTYTSSNKKIATVNSKGVVKGIKKGKATITVKANGKTVKVKVTVK